jgi:hypothetical protein
LRLLLVELLDRAERIELVEESAVDHFIFRRASQRVKIAPMRRVVILSLAALPAAALAAAPPSALAKVAGGLWEISGVPGASAPVRQCVADVLTLAQFEHRSRTCTHTVITDDGSSTLIRYSCGAAGFGHSEIDVITPRSLRIATQGISDELPFNYVLQAHRVGDCEKSASSSSH